MLNQLYRLGRLLEASTYTRYRLPLINSPASLYQEFQTQRDLSLERLDSELLRVATRLDEAYAAYQESHNRSRFVKDLSEAYEFYNSRLNYLLT